MRNSSGNNFSNWREINKSYRKEFADEIVAKISESVDFKKFLQAVFDEKILTARQGEVLKLLYGFDDGIVKNANQVAIMLWVNYYSAIQSRWDAFVKILQSEIYKDLFPEENEENHSFDVIKQKREKILKNLDDDLDNYEYYIDDLLALENMEISEESDIIEALKNKKIREILIKTLSRKDFSNNAKQKEIFIDLYGLHDGVVKKWPEIAKKYGITRQRVDQINKQFITKMLEIPEVREELFEIWKEE